MATRGERIAKLRGEFYASIGRVAGGLGSAVQPLFNRWLLGRIADLEAKVERLERQATYPGEGGAG